MSMTNAMDRDWEALAGLTEETRAIALDYLAGLPDRPVAARDTAYPETALPRQGVGAEGALRLFQQAILPNLSASPGPIGRRNSSPSMSSVRAVRAEATESPLIEAFWSMAETSQSPSSAAGLVPPIT